VGRSYRGRNEFGAKSGVQIKLDGCTLERVFRNKGEAIQYLMKTEGLEKHEVNNRKRVRFIFN
jgi:hypothetical protein